MADSNLINIAGKVAQSGVQRDYSKDFGKAFDKTFKNEIDKQKAIDDKVFGHMDQLEYKGNMTDLTETQKSKINNFLVQQRNTYADAANQIAKIKDSQDPKYMELRDKMNTIRNSFSNLAGQVEKYKTSKVEFLTDYDKGLVSKGNDLDSLGFAAKVFTEGGDINISETGDLQFLNDNNKQFVNLSNVKKPFLKDKDGATKLSKIVNTVYNNAMPLTGQREKEVKKQIRLVLQDKGSESLKSLLADGLLTDEKIDVDPELMKPENEDKLLEFALDTYMVGVKASAQQGYDEKRKSKVTTTKDKNRFGQALRDELATAEPIKNKALAFSRLSSKPSSKKVVTALNSIDPTKKGKYIDRNTAFQMWLTKEEKEDDDTNRAAFRKLYPRTQQVFIYDQGDVQPIGVNIGSPKELFDLYLKNTDLSSKAVNQISGTTELKKGVGSKYNN